MSRSLLPDNPNLLIDYSASRLRDIWLAGGCFWGVEAYMARVPGVADTTVGYANGQTENPTYEDVCTRNTGHAETVHVRYDPELISLIGLLEQFFLIIDPTSRNRQGNDRGSQYRSGVYYLDPADLPEITVFVAAEQKKHDQPIVTEIERLRRFDAAEDYHQDYLEKNPQGYCHVRFDTLPGTASDAAAQVNGQVHGQNQAQTQAQGQVKVSRKPVVDPTQYPRPSDDDLHKILTPAQYQVTRKDATEQPFTGAYWDLDEPGIYVDVVTGEPLFVSSNKFESDCGWPSFSKPLDPTVVHERIDKSHDRIRTEIRSRSGDSHLGHVFTDGPADAGGLRYCINSAALSFIPLAEMEEKGYGSFIPLVKEQRPGKQ